MFCIKQAGPCTFLSLAFSAVSSFAALRDCFCSCLVVNCVDKGGSMGLFPRWWCPHSDLELKERFCRSNTDPWSALSHSVDYYTAHSRVRLTWWWGVVRYERQESSALWHARRVATARSGPSSNGEQIAKIGNSRLSERKLGKATERSLPSTLLHPPTPLK